MGTISQAIMEESEAGCHEEEAVQCAPHFRRHKSVIEFFLGEMNWKCFSSTVRHGGDERGEGEWG